MECGKLFNSEYLKCDVQVMQQVISSSSSVIQCPVSCGGGLRSRSVHCVSTNTRELTQGCDRATKPEKVTACALNECPPSPGNVEHITARYKMM